MKTMHGEILSPLKRASRHDTSSDVSFWPTSFDGEKKHFTVIPGLTIEQIVGLAIPQRAMWQGITVCLKSDAGIAELLPEYWRSIKPRPGVNIEITYTPMGEDGGKILRSVLTIVVLIAATLIAPELALALGFAEAGVAATVIGATIGALGMLAVNALVPVKPPVSSVQDTPTSSTGFSNRFAFGQPIPTVHGKLRVYPNMAAQNYFESVGDDRYQRSLFLLGRGPCELSDFKIGSQPLDEFEDVSLEIIQGWDDDPVPTLYQREVNEEAFGTDLATGTPEIFTTPLSTIETQIDFVFPEGLITYDSKGKRQSRTVSVNIEYRKVGDTLWNNIPAVFEAGGFNGRILFPFHGAGFGGYSGYTGYAGDYGSPVAGSGGLSHPFSAKSDRPIIRNKKITFPDPGQYEVRCNRTTAAGGDQTRDKIQVAILRSFKVTPPIKVTGLCLVALRIRLTAQKSSQISNFNCVVQKLTPYHNGTSWIDPVTTRDAVGDMTPHRSRTPAAAYCDVLRGVGVRRTIPDNRLDMTSIQEWWDYGAANDIRTGLPRHTYDAVILGRTTAREMINEICTVGRARLAAPNGQYGVVRDKPQTLPVNMFTARNSKNLSGSFNLGTPVHGLKIKFANESKDGQEETYISYAVGYDENTATEFEEITMRGMVNIARVHDFGRYFLEVIKFRAETIQITTYVDAMHNLVGHYVVINHDVPRHGLAAGRILSLTTDVNSDITSITIDETVTMEVGKEYAVSIRRPSNTNMVVNAVVNTVAGDQQLLIFTTPIVSSMAVNVKDLVTFGEKDKVTRDVLITGIRHLGKDYIFELTCVDLANAVHDVETEALPVFNNTSVPDPEVTPPGVVTNLVLTENIIYPAGVAKSEVWATWTSPVGIPIAQFEIYDDFNGEFTLLGTSQDNRYRLPGDLVAGEDITVRVVAVSLSVNKLPVRLATSAVIFLDGIADTIAALTGLAVTVLPAALKINWNASAVLAVKGTHLYRAPTDVQPATPYKSFAIPIDEFRDDIGSAGQTYYYWVRPYDQDDVIGPWNAATGISGVTGALAQPDADNTAVAQFTPIISWNLDNSLSGWTVTGGTTVLFPSYMELTSSGSAPQLRGPVMSINGAVDTLVRARIRRTSGTGWNGTCYFATPSLGIGVAGSVNVSDPTVLDEWVIIEWDMSGVSNWTAGDIIQIRLDLADAASNVIEVDWIAVGRLSALATVGADWGDNLTGKPTDTTQLIPDPLLANGTTAWKTANAKHTIEPDTISGGFTNRIKMIGDGVEHESTIVSVPVVAGEKLFVRYSMLKASPGVGAEGGMRIRFTKADGSNSSGTVIAQDEGVLSGTVWGEFTGEVVVPAEMVEAHLIAINRATHTTGSLYLADPRISRHAFGADITDYTDDRVQNSGLQLNADGIMSYWNGTSAVNLGATTFGGLGGKALGLLDLADWSTKVSNRPAELTDGRISTGLNSLGNLIGNVFDQTKLPNLLAGGAGAVFSVKPITNSVDAGSTATVNMAATTMQLGSVSVNYPSGSITGLSFGTTYYIYGDDPEYDGTLSGGYVATTNANNLALNDGRVFFGSVTTVNDGGSGGGTPPDLPECVGVGMWLDDYQAVDAAAGTSLAILNDDSEGYHLGAIESVEFSPAACVEIITVSGCRLVCSNTTPITLKDGSTVLAPDCRYVEVAVLDRGSFRWEKVATVADVGIQDVAHIHIDGRTYAAGSVPDKQIFTHNPLKV